MVNVNSVLNSNSKVAVASHRVLNTRGKVGRLGVRLTVCTNTPKPSFWEQRLSESRPPVIIAPRLRLTGLPFFIQHRTQLDHPDSRQSCLLQNQNQTWNLFLKHVKILSEGVFLESTGCRGDSECGLNVCGLSLGGASPQEPERHSCQGWRL